jgi:hypothetical protein
MIFTAAAAGATHAAAMRNLIFGGPGAAFGYFLGYAPLFVTLFNVLGLTLLLVRVTALIATGHGNLLGNTVNTPTAI